MQERHPFKNVLNKLSGQPSGYLRKADYTFGKTLGAGAFGIVRYARNNVTHENVAVKIILKKALKGNEQMILEELSLLRELKHPNIVQFIEFFESKDKFYLVTQLAIGGELFDRIVQRGKFTERDASNVLVQILLALKYLHGKNIVHRDLKPENILYLTEKEDSNIVLADFGIAKKLASPNEQLKSSAGSLGYAAPEVVMGAGHGKPCDIWSLGVIAYTLLCGYSPFTAENVTEFVDEVTRNNTVLFHADYWRHVSKDARRFIVKALLFDPSKRPKAEELLQDKWLTTVAPHLTKDDLLPKFKEGFNARRKFRQAIAMIILNNKIKNLRKFQDDDDDPLEINLFGDEGIIEEPVALDNYPTKEAPSSSSEHLNPFQGKSRRPLQSSSDPSSRSNLTGDAFVHLVQAASENKERVNSYKE